MHVYERDSWDQTFAFSSEDGHSKDVALVAWSPNGEYLASVSIHGEIIVWETQSKQTLGRFKHRDAIPICDIAWHPSGNEILWADNHGKFSVWKEPVPDASQFAKPTGGDAASEANASAQQLANLFPDDDDEEIGTKKRRRLKQKRVVAKDDSDSDNCGGCHIGPTWNQ